MYAIQIKSQLALAAARRSLEEKENGTDLAKELKIGRGSISHAKLILQYGTPEQINDVSEGLIGVRAAYLAVKARLTPQQLALWKRQSGTITDVHRELAQTDSDLWGKFEPALRGLGHLPDPSDMVAVIKSNRMRIKAVNKHLNIALKWLEEFSHEWAKYTQQKSSSDNHADPRTSNETIRTQHTQPSTK